MYEIIGKDNPSAADINNLETMVNLMKDFRIIITFNRP